MNASPEKITPETCALAASWANLSPLLVEIRARRSEFGRAQKVPEEIIEGFKRVGVYRAMVAKRFGGEERTPADFCRLIERISEADGSAGWVASFGDGARYLAALPDDTLCKVYANGPDVVLAGALFPLQPAKRTSDGFVVNGVWPFASGSPGADLIGVGITVEDDPTGELPRVAVMPAEKVTIRPNWDVIGLRGTGSHDVVVSDVIVPEEWTLIRGGPPTIDVPLYHYPSVAFAAQAHAIVGIGIARSALDEVVAMAGSRASITGAPVMAERGYIQLEIARAEAMLRSARSFFYEATEELWMEALKGAATLGTTTLMRLAATNAARQGAEVCRIVGGLAGTEALDTNSNLARAMCDSFVVAQHAALNEGTLQSAGRFLLQRAIQPGFP
ncbi:acyl-CoA dehydrogenase [Bradyrhizobium sacchari]|uniref:Alkylation response protein AidB-like acyl-CoA dehydrogenase n=2 Tax=Bradyrhizobium sacchari TaxID=1399419 RepID=A0A560JBQ0_9BRAD|nr:acyl-CoA dehydrogenase [Bradyrhizobium sacchari]TWB48758.1 alkylation response protein AidB-like acyl-CoA dehydrogenase [Bradyrhizobium sacchari]TWB67919.1 alkylation response protein AidB-like acyl-CoA dehydrogenase [Bradyrhizobium sacchari]